MSSTCVVSKLVVCSMARPWASGEGRGEWEAFSGVKQLLGPLNQPEGLGPAPGPSPSSRRDPGQYAGPPRSHSIPLGQSRPARWSQVLQTSPWPLAPGSPATAASGQREMRVQASPYLRGAQVSLQRP